MFDREKDFQIYIFFKIVEIKVGEFVFRVKNGLIFKRLYYYLMLGWEWISANYLQYNISLQN